MPREQVRGANRQKRVASVTHSSRLLSPNPRNLPPTRHHPPPARGLSRVTRFLAPRGGFVDGPGNEATCFRCAASSRRRAPWRLSPSAHARDLRGSRATLPNPTGRSTRGHGATRLSPTRTFGLPSRARRQTGKSGGETRRPLSLPGKTPYPAPRFSEPARGISRRELVSPVTRVPLPGRCARRIRSSRPRPPSPRPATGSPDPRRSR